MPPQPLSTSPRRRLAGAHQSWQRSACATARAPKRRDLRPGWAREAGQPQSQTAHISLHAPHTQWSAGTAPGGSEVGPATVLQKPGVARRCGPSEGLLAPSPPPTPAGCRGGAQRLPSLPGRRSGKRGRQHTSVRALAPDSLLSTQTRAWGLNARIGGLQNRPGGAKSRAQAVEPMCPCQLLLGKPNRLCGSFTPNRRRPPLPLLCWLMDTML